jgi:glycosyltransferase involved in cell wall biosynthesis
MTQRPHISVVIPVFDEAENVSDLHREITASLEGHGRPYEVIFVDDGSRDATVARLVEIEARDPRVRVLRLRRNFGQTAAFSAGFDHARGDVVVTSDGDLQNDPADIPLLLARLDEGFDMVCGWRRDRKDPGSKRVPSWFANRLISWATGVRLNDYGCSLKAMRVEVVRGMRLYGEMHRFIPAIASWMGVSVAEVAVNHRPRTRGRSKYGLGRTQRVLLDLFTVKFLLAYGTRPSHLFGKWGLTSGFLGGAILAYLTYVKFYVGESIGGRPLLFVGMGLVLFGVQLICTGLLAEMLVRIYHESQGKPTYVVKEVHPPSVAEHREPAPPVRAPLVGHTKG